VFRPREVGPESFGELARPFDLIPPARRAARIRGGAEAGGGRFGTVAPRCRRVRTLGSDQFPMLGHWCCLRCINLPHMQNGPLFLVLAPGRYHPPEGRHLPARGVVRAWTRPRWAPTRQRAAVTVRVAANGHRTSASTGQRRPRPASRDQPARINKPQPPPIPGRARGRAGVFAGSPPGAQVLPARRSSFLPRPCRCHASSTSTAIARHSSPDGFNSLCPSAADLVVRGEPRPG